MSDSFYIASPTADPVCWETLINDLCSKTDYNPYIKSDDYYNIFRDIVYSMLCGVEITLLDSDFTDSEIENLTETQNAAQIVMQGKKLLVNGLHDLIRQLKITAPTWGVTIFTSGTTGKPKKVTHSYESITRFVRSGDNYSNNIWGFAYSPTHMAGLQVFFQAILNGNTIVRLFGLSQSDIFKQIEKYDVTNISATPTFYRLLLPATGVYRSVQRLTSGGEKFDSNVTKQLSEAFPNAKVSNIYASTELGTLFASSSNVFTIRSSDSHLIRIINNELYVHRSMMGKSDITSGEQWYNTGDLVEIVTPEPLSFKIISRSSSMINVGGYKVNPIEVEDTIREYNGVSEVRVFAKNNPLLGNIIIAEVCLNNSEITELEIRKFLQGKLQEYKIPRVIKFVNEISVTRTGKIDRK